MSTETDSRAVHPPLLRRVAVQLESLGISPGALACLCMLFAAFAGAGLVLSVFYRGNGSALCLLVTTLACQLRQVGMLLLQYRGDTSEHTDDSLIVVWRVLADRVFDVTVLVGLGFAAGTPAMGWAAVALAFLVAYTQVLARRVGMPKVHSGPMEFEQRASFIAFVALLAAVVELFAIGRFLVISPHALLLAALWLILLGCLFNSCRYMGALLKFLESH